MQLHAYKKLKLSDAHDKQVMQQYASVMELAIKTCGTSHIDQVMSVSHNKG